mgnify:CR=1 FL=1
MRCVRPILAVLLALVLCGVSSRSAAQAPDSTQANSTQADSAESTDSTRHWTQDAWTPIATRQGLRFAYLFYQKADNANNGVVIRLYNTNPYALRYAFTVVFRTPNAERTARATGAIAARAMKTGEGDGLFWIPFPDGRTIGEIGLRGIRIAPARRQR